MDENGLRYLENKGMVLGLVPHQTWHAQSAPFHQGTKLILLSDGILEILPQNNMDEKQRYLADFFAQQHEKDITKTLHQLIPEALHSIPDDITLLMVSK